MTGIELWSTTAASNNSASPNGWPEGMPPSGVNDSARQMMAAIRTWYESAEWINLGYTPTYISGTSFSLVGDKTSDFQVGRRVKMYGTTPSTLYGTIATSAYTSLTTVTVTMDSGTIDSNLTTVWISIISINSSSFAGAPFIDSTAIIKGSADPTKLIKIEADGITTATTRTWTAPDADLTVVGVSTTQTLTNKKLSDSTCTIVDNGDDTKQVAFECSGIATSTTRTLGVPDKSGTLALTSDLTIMYSHISGFTPSSIAGTSTTASITVGSGQAADSTNASYISKGTTTSWDVSNGNAINGYEGGTTLPNSSTIHFFVCSGASGTGTFASTSLTPTFPTGYDSYYRRIFSLKTTGAGALIPGTSIEIGGGAQLFYLTTQVLDVNTSALGTSRTLYTLSVPAGIKVEPLIRALGNTTTAFFIVLTSPDETDVAPATVFSNVPGQDLSSNNGGPVSTLFLTTNTSGQIGARANTTSISLAITTRGWIDFRR